MPIDIVAEHIDLGIMFAGCAGEKVPQLSQIARAGNSFVWGHALARGARKDVKADIIASA